MATNEIWLSTYWKTERKTTINIQSSSTLFRWVRCLKRNRLTKLEAWKVIESDANTSHRTHWNFIRCDLQDLKPFLTVNASRRPGQHCKRAITPNEDWYLTLTARGHQNLNANLRQQHLRHHNFDSNCTKQTPWRRSDQWCVCVYGNSKAPWRGRGNWRRNQWRNTFFPDEWRFSVYPGNGRTFIWGY